MLNTPVRRLALLLFLSPLFAGFVCKPNSNPDNDVVAAARVATQTSSNEAAQVDELSVDVLGASNTVLSYLITDDLAETDGWLNPPSSDTEMLAEPGWSTGCAMSAYQESIANNAPDATVIVDVIYNDADPRILPGQKCDSQNNDGGYTLYDLVKFIQFMEATPIGSCIVVELPWYGPEIDAAWAYEIREARTYLFDLATPYGQFQPPPGRHIVLNDWRLVTGPQPHGARFTGPDGGHISGTPAAIAWQDLMWDGVHNCPNVVQ